jgi:hypothetical protein
MAYRFNMKRAKNKESKDDLRPEYNLSKLKGGVRGKYAKRFQKGTNLVFPRMLPSISPMNNR